MDDPVCKSEPSCLSFEEDQNLGCCLPGIQILHLVSVPSKFSFKCLSENTLVVSNFLMLTSVAGVQTKQINWRLSQIWPNVFLRYDFLIFMNYLTMQKNLFFWNVFQIRRALLKNWQILPYLPITYYYVFGFCSRSEPILRSALIISKTFWWCRKFKLELAVMDFTRKLGVS